MTQKLKYFEIIDGRTGKHSYLAIEQLFLLRDHLGTARFNELRIRRIHPRTGIVFGTFSKSPYWHKGRYKLITDMA